MNTNDNNNTPDPSENDEDVTAYLLAVMDGVAPPDPAAKAIATQLGLPQMRVLLGTALYRYDCPSPDELVEYAEHRLSGYRTGEIALHLEDCPHCSGELASWRAFQAAIAEEPRPAPEARPLRWIRAWLQPAAQPAAAVRGAAQDVRVYAAPSWQLLLMVEDATPPFKRITGQLLPTGAITAMPDAVALLYDTTATGEGEKQPRREKLDQLGSFSFDHLPADTYALHVAISPEAQIVVEDLAIADRPGE